MYSNCIYDKQTRFLEAQLTLQQISCKLSDVLDSLQHSNLQQVGRRRLEPIGIMVFAVVRRY